MRELPWLLLIALVLLPIAGIPADGDGAPSFDRDRILADLETYLESLDKAAIAENSVGALGLRLHFFPDARRYEICQRMRRALNRKEAPAAVVERLRGDEDFGKLYDRLRKKAGFRLDLLHPQGTEEVIRVRQVVHIFHAKLTKAFSLKLGAAEVRWGGWRDPRGLEVKTVRIARHWTIQHGRRVPKTSPMEPKHPRAVMRADKASVWGTIPVHLLGKKRGTFRLTARSFDEFTGHYTDEHIIDLNEEAHVLKRELSLATQRSLPFFFPEIPNTLEEFLQWVEGELE